MNKDISKVDNIKEYMYYFDSITDTYRYIMDNKKEIPSGASTLKRDKFYGGISFKEALKRLLNGDEELAKDINNIKIDGVVAEKLTFKYINDIQGVVPNVPNFLMGLPQSMVRIQRTKIKSSQKILNLVFDISVSCTITKEEYMQVSKLFLDVIDKVEKMGYRCNLYIAAVTVSESEKFMNTFLIKLKNSNELFNRYKCSFVLGHMSMLRRIMFRLIELADENDINVKYYSGYGTVTNRNLVKKTVEDTFKINHISFENFKIFRIYDYINADEQVIINKIVK
jgi:hypothetical protein